MANVITGDITGYFGILAMLKVAFGSYYSVWAYGMRPDEMEIEDDSATD